MKTSGINGNLAGFAKTPRNILYSDYLYDERLLRAWVVITLCMRFKSTVIDSIPLEEGDALFTKDELSELLGVDKRTVRTILGRMSRDGLIKYINIRNSYTLISVIDPMMTSLERTSEEEETEDLRAYRESVNRERRKHMNNALSPEEKEAKKSDDEVISPVAHSERSLFPAVESCEVFREDFSSVQEKEMLIPEEKDIREEKAEGLGIFGNVFISEEEMRSLKKTMPGYYETYIDKLSAYMKNAPDKGYKNHCAVILSWFMRDKAEGKLPKPDIPSGNETKDTYTNRREEKYMRNFSQNSVSSLNKNTSCTPDPTASYDILEAQRRAMAGVPTSTKRRKR